MVRFEFATEPFGARAEMGGAGMKVQQAGRRAEGLAVEVSSKPPMQSGLELQGFSTCHVATHITFLFPSTFQRCVKHT